MTTKNAGDAALGVLIQRGELPTEAGMDAIEARLIVTQEVPPKAEVRFYAVRGDSYEQLASDAALTVLRAHIPPRPVTALNQAELLVEVSVLRAEVDHMRPIYLAAKAWREHRRSWPADTTADAALVAAIDATVDGANPSSAAPEEIPALTSSDPGATLPP